jgi:hypothetical protein
MRKCCNYYLRSSTKNISTLILSFILNTAFFVFICFGLGSITSWTYVQTCPISGYRFDCPNLDACTIQAYVKVERVCPSDVRGGTIATYSSIQHALRIWYTKINSIVVNTVHRDCWIRSNCHEFLWYEPFDVNGSISTGIFIFFLLIAMCSL